MIFVLVSFYQILEEANTGVRPILLFARAVLIASFELVHPAVWTFSELSSGVIYAPKVATGLSPVSTLGSLKIKEFALKLKGRKADLIKLAPNRCAKNYRAQLRRAPREVSGGLPFRVVDAFHWDSQKMLA
jgi:hypothetical protein